MKYFVQQEFKFEDYSNQQLSKTCVHISIRLSYIDRPKYGFDFLHNKRR